MIIGNGLIGNAFERSEHNFDNYVIFASGVSNSKNCNAYHFNREKELILKTLAENQDKKFVYFTSVLSTIGDNAYYKHKQEMEKLIRETIRNHIIFSVPQIVGNKGNCTNLINDLMSSLRQRKRIIVYGGVQRALLDVDDLVNIVHYCRNQVARTVFVSRIEKIAVIDLCFLLADVIGYEGEPNIKIERPLENNEWLFDNSGVVFNALNELRIKPEGYTKKIIEKYYK